MASEPIQALLSVWHKEEALPLAKTILEVGGTLWASAGTARFLQEKGLPAQSIEGLTGFAELLGGRVKTLHPAIFSGILARPGEPLPEGFPQWNLVAVELYPFTPEAPDWIELIDIGGVSLLRAAAKNFARVWAIAGVAHFPQAIQDLQIYKGLPPQMVRYRYAAETFAHCARYDAHISAAFLGKTPTESATYLRYGENPHQKAYFLGKLPEVVGQKQPSYNNLLDIETGLRIVRGWPKPACVILKHTQPCGAAFAEDPVEAYQHALAADPVAAYGGVVVCNFPVDVQWAQATKGHFIEVIAAPHFTREAKEWLQAHKSALLVETEGVSSPGWEVRSAVGGLLWQESHLAEEPSLDETLRWAARLLRSLYSNAIVVVHEGELVAAASGQTSRIEAVRLALARAQQRPFPPEKLLLASDGFFPFTDSLEAIYQAGIRQVAVPPGGKRQAEIEHFARTHDICLTFLTYRHFRH
ncbi:MAG: hypothetical protein N3A68_06540 [Bacteroidia bacterium]|jgi:phosphoribosylaminoimidazolecarboxamide formyltransferase/IMP cyclohydrolase|nr:hypothetical protein [Bacteroidia bacterium]GIV22700.1 MAG: bifunctional phosphoribosylaminoimidazolecarboxamide formyltransferase/inosine monophosphate cyclohydrolase [Bacteroidia bacterium]